MTKPLLSSLAHPRLHLFFLIFSNKPSTRWFASWSTTPVDTLNIPNTDRALCSLKASINFKWLPYFSFIALVTSHISIIEPTGGLIRSSVIKAQLYCTEIKRVYFIAGRPERQFTLWVVHPWKYSLPSKSLLQTWCPGVLIFPVTDNDTHRCSKLLTQNLPQVWHEVFPHINPNQIWHSAKLKKALWFYLNECNLGLVIMYHSNLNVNS